MEVEEPWRPGQAVTHRTSICDIAAALAFGQQDQAFAAIGEQLKARNCVSVDDFSRWLKGEFLMLVKSCPSLNLTKHRNAYLAGFESATGIKLEVERAVKGEAGPLSKVKKQSGGDTSALSKKQPPSNTFNASKWLPDLRVYQGVAKKDDAEYIGDEEEKLYLDKLWLAAHVRLARISHSTHIACTLAPARAIRSPRAHSHGVLARSVRGRRRIQSLPLATTSSMA